MDQTILERYWKYLKIGHQFMLSLNDLEWLRAFQGFFAVICINALFAVLRNVGDSITGQQIEEKKPLYLDKG
ncbi:hypothetical protein WJ0W_002064 [Paenibacillus melissococcoides]|uniref:Uncharacterized protein n=1 Tax=Paenibacillus melissococcoides TaxID=2912268 RepID=A0ABN8U1F8_9BACL|nr:MULTISPECIES: hypothetical protein [Paenibacillus]MEB9898099.1 hypothetical protein [Bacillus cereus]CAH8244833.1 hypothetical protein WJ0W_002064 [Paenibacillus melissococcoides]CAH8709111.1 hypothetical protein WDD9_002146 [Paenibacillus melissococcoides]CAH8709867.1 hypothetical protein HTL2_002434 [Paenibacillus melissococcoides]